MIGRRSRFGDRRRGRQTVWRFTRLLVVAAAVAAVGSYAYRVGESAGQARAAKLESDLERFQNSDLGLRDRLTGLAQRSGQLEQELEALRRRYAEDVPQGPAAELVERLRDQLVAGADPERLEFLIGAAGQVDACQAEPQTKRFILATGIGGTTASAVRFDDRITVTGRGRAARNEQGLTEAWFDPTEPVRLEFHRLDGEMDGVAGTLPLSHRMAVGDREIRFSAIAGERSFVEVTAQVCPLPALPDAAADPAPDQAAGQTGPDQFQAPRPPELPDQAGPGRREASAPAATAPAAAAPTPATLATATPATATPATAAREIATRPPAAAGTTVPRNADPEVAGQAAPEIAVEARDVALPIMVTSPAVERRSSQNEVAVGQ